MGRWLSRIDNVTAFCAPSSARSVAAYVGNSLLHSERYYMLSCKIDVEFLKKIGQPKMEHSAWIDVFRSSSKKRLASGL